MAETNLLLIKATLAEIAEYLRAQPPSTETGEWTSKAQAYERVVESWATLGHSEAQEATTLECVMDLRAEVLSACKRTTLAAPPMGPRED